MLAPCLLVTGAVLVRALFDVPVVWVPEIVGYLMVVLVFLALGEAMLAGSHIRIDLLVGRLPRRPREVLELLTLTLSTGVAGFFAAQRRDRISYPLRINIVNVFIYQHPFTQGENRHGRQ